MRFAKLGMLVRGACRTHRDADPVVLVVGGEHVALPDEVLLHLTLQGSTGAQVRVLHHSSSRLLCNQLVVVAASQADWPLATILIVHLRMRRRC